MKWILFTGTWRLTNKEVEEDVRDSVRQVLSLGNGVVTGGATGVDYFAMDESMKIFPDASRIKVIIPANLKSYIYDYNTNWCHDPITKENISDLESILLKIKNVNPDALIEMPNDVINQDHYDLRSEEETKIAEEVYAFQVNDSTGVQYTIKKAIERGLPITLHKKYSIN